MTVTVRNAIAADAPAIHEILVGVISHGGLTALSIDDISPFVTSKIEEYVQTGSFIVAETDRVIGFQYLSPYPGLSGHVADIATFSEMGLRQTGIGRMMFQETRRIARQKGFLKITARIRGDNSNGIPYYSKMGFREVGIYRNHTRIDGKLTDQVLTELLL